MATLSVIVPTYNRAATIERTLESLIGQVRLPDEVIVVDDGSTDGTRLLPIMTHPAIRSVRNPANMGVTFSRNAGAQHARGDFIAFLDSDDTVLPEWSEKLMSGVEQGSVISSCGLRRTNEVSGQVEVRTPRHYRKGLFRPYRWLFIPGSFVVSRAVFREVGGYAKSIGVWESPELAARLADHCRLRGLTISSVDDVLLDCKTHPARTLGRVEEAWRSALYILERHGHEMSRKERARFHFDAGRNAVLSGRGRASAWISWRGVFADPTKSRLIHASFMTLSPRTYSKWWSGRIMDSVD